jgi:hypothetical protein
MENGQAYYNGNREKLFREALKEMPGEKSEFELDESYFWGKGGEERRGKRRTWSCSYGTMSCIYAAAKPSSSCKNISLNRRFTNRRFAAT